MTKPVRPGPVTAMAVVCFLFGGSGILMFLCLTGGMVFVVAFVSNPPAVPAGQQNPVELFNMLDRAAPSLKYFYFTTFALSLVLCTLEVIAGFGLLKMRYWGRSLALVYAVLSIILIVGESAYGFTVLQPAMERWQQDLQKMANDMNQKAAGNAGKANAPAPPPPPAPFGGAGNNPLLQGTSSVMGMVVGLVWPCILLFIMFMPTVRKAFAVANGDAVADDEPDDYHDRDYDDLDRPAGNRDRDIPPDDGDKPDDGRFRARPD